MDITHINTFLAVVENGTFVGAADQVNITQSAVSIRIKTLEERLGVTLFERSKQGASLTADGHRFFKYAQGIVRLWSQARTEVGLSDEASAILKLGGQVSLWEGFLINWMVRVRELHPDLVVKTEMGSPLYLTQKLVEGALDVAFLYRPPHRPGFNARHLFDEKLVMVSTNKGATSNPGDDYVMTYWGPEFQADHALNFPEIETPRVQTDLGPIGLHYLFARGGTGYFPTRVVEPHFEQEELFLVKDAPTFSYPVYMMTSEDIDSDLAGIIKEGLATAIA